MEEKKLKILISCLFFGDYTGSEMYVYELAKNLLKLNCEVTILSQRTLGPLIDVAKSLGIKVENTSNPPGYKRGDGIWTFQTPNGLQKSVPNHLYKIQEVDYDIIHCQHKPVTELINTLYPNIKKIAAIHSEVINLENPVIHPSIKKYIAIRPEIKEHIIKNFNIPEQNIELIYNPIDSERFNTKNTSDKGYTLFVGTIDNLRKNTLFDLADYTKKENRELWIVGKNHSNYLEVLKMNTHVKHFDSTNNVEFYVKNCHETAGILLGRTTIEGWMCGKPGWIYNVDSNGNIKNKNKYNVPNDTEKFDSKSVSIKIKKIYKEIIK
jgi:glycosyltransferase involved in cell wall biosynthesis